jgi:hypothetical protein
MAIEEIPLRQRGAQVDEVQSATPGNFAKPPNQGFLKFLWNGEKKEFLGRTGCSWGEHFNK